MSNYCDNCEHSATCEIAFETEFCDDCKDRFNCNIRYYNSCAAGHDVECNNGFEPLNDYDNLEDEDE